MQATTTAEEGKLTGVKIAREMIEQVNDHAAGFALSAPFGNVKMALAAIDKIELNDIR
jgi:hypothetical protein